MYLLIHAPNIARNLEIQDGSRTFTVSISQGPKLTVPNRV